MQYKAKINPFNGQLQLVPTNIVLVFKTGVATQASLPLSGNAVGDARIANDTGHLYVWSIESSSGLLTDWVDAGDIVDLNWSAISGKPSSAVADIDDAVNNRHAPTSDNQVADTVPTEDTGISVQDALNTLEGISHTQETDKYLTTMVTNVLYVDNKRTDALPTLGGYTPNGSITKPFIKIQDAIDAVVAPSATNKYLIEIAPGAYYSDVLTINKVYVTFRSCGLQGARISGAITVTNPSSPTPEQITFVGIRISGGLTCLASHIAINCVDCNVTGSAWTMNPTVPTDDEYLQVFGGLYNVTTTLTNVYTYLMGGGYYCSFTATNGEFNINNADINDPFQVTLNGTIIASAYGDRAGNSKFILTAGATLNIDADTEGGSVVTVNSGTILNRTTKASNINNDSTVSGETVKDALNMVEADKSDKSVTINTQTTDYTLVLTDIDKLIDMNCESGSGILTVPKNSVVAFPIGTTVAILQSGLVEIIITPIDGDVIINNQNGLVTTGQYAMASLLKTGTNTWIACGALGV